jgi:hypothetical protein
MTSSTLFTTPGTDHAEYFEYEDGNPNEEDRRGRTVVMGNNGFIRVSTVSDDPHTVFGVVSSTPGFVTNVAENHWDRKFKRDKFGNPVSNTVYYLANVASVGNIHGDRHRCAPDAPVVEGYLKISESEYVINETYDSTKTYVSREKRREWDPIGLVGKLRILEDQTVNPSWTYLNTIYSPSGNVEEYLLTSGAGIHLHQKVTDLQSELAAIKLHLGL